MTAARIAELRRETVDMFYHGYDNYMNVAFPEDELRPVSCTPLTRDSNNPSNVALNDVLGNYSLTLIDSLSTLAILASAPPDDAAAGAKALLDFQDGVAALVLHYGDGSSGSAGRGLRARGFDVDSKVQVFETVIRGVGGLVSAHLFASGELPVSGYEPRSKAGSRFDWSSGGKAAVAWPNGFKYDGQLLRLALDLAQRLLPAFYTATGMPYPRVNLRHGIPFYTKSPLHEGFDMSDHLQDSPEITETCSAGAGSLVLEFTVLSRLTGDTRFEQLAKRAFWAVWDRRSNIGLIGAGVDAESGHWIGPYAGIGAGADSFFEYALKTHILLSGHEMPNLTVSPIKNHKSWLDPNNIYKPLTMEENSPEAFLGAWHEAHAAIKRHLYSGTHHPHYVNAHLLTGSPQAYWIDSLGAYYPGLLTLAGEVEEAVETNLLYTALWTRYAALPERWSVTNGHVEGGLGWWPGRPEFIESNYHLYRATKDPWYLHVGEMVLEDIKRRCWTKCGWSGLQDVRTGEKSDRMESFFLGETAKYLYLLFDTDHPLNSLDAAYVFTTEGHPLLIPKERTRPSNLRTWPATTKEVQPHSGLMNKDTCPAAASTLPFTISQTAARTDLFHAASLIGLHLIPNVRAISSKKHKITVSPDDLVEPRHPNHTYYPWTLPTYMIPSNGTCDPIPMKTTFSIEFPVSTPLNSQQLNQGFNLVVGPQALVRLTEGILVKSLSGLKLNMVYESPSPFATHSGRLKESYRVWNIANMALGRDEQVLIPRDLIGDIHDPAFSRIQDLVMLDILIQLENTIAPNQSASGDSFEYATDEHIYDDATPIEFEDDIGIGELGGKYRSMLDSILSHVTSALRDPAATSFPQPDVVQTYRFVTVPAVAPTGVGAAPIVEVKEAPDPNGGKYDEPLSWSSIYFADQACDGKLPEDSAKHHNIIVIKRGGCTFSEKLANIPSFTPTKQGLKLVIMVDDKLGEETDDGLPAEHTLVRPFLETAQKTPSGLLRHHQISMAMIGGGDKMIELLRKAKSVGLRRRYHVESQGMVVGNILVI